VRLVLTDLMMPVMDGAALIHALRSRDTMIPIIVFSGLLEPEHRAQIEVEGAVSVLPKPCDAPKLLSTVARELAAGR
jgi:CheY-like chemotaxis protein